MKPTRASTLARYTAIATATPKFLPNFTFLIAGQSYTAQQVVTIINTMIAASNGVTDASSSLRTARAAEKAAQTQYGPFLGEVEQVVSVAFSNVPGTLDAFAIPPKKPRTPLSAAARAAAEAKAKATRAARGTKGKNQKAAISGNVAGVNITPVINPATPSGSAGPGTPAAPAAAQGTASSPSSLPATGTGSTTPHA